MKAFFESLVRKSSTLLMVIFVGGFAVAGIAATRMETLKTKGIVVATDATYPPMEFEGDNGEPIGFDVDLIKAIGARMGVPVKIQVMSWDGILAGLTAKRYDAVISSLNITPDREKQVRFVPYMSLAQAFVTRPGPEAKQGSFSESDLTGKVVAVQADTTSAELVRKLRDEKGIKIKELKEFRNATDTFAAVKAKQAQVIVIDEVVGRYYQLRDPKSFVISGRSAAAEPVGIALQKSDADLAKAMEQALADLKKDGTYRQLSIKWFGAEL